MTVPIEQPVLPDAARDLSPDQIRQLCDEGIAACRLGDWEKGVDTLYAVIGAVPTAKEIPSLAYSYLGYGRAALGAGYKDGIKLCRLGIRKDVFEAENYLNLARTCLLRDRRQMAVKALNGGLRVSPRHPQLRDLRSQLGWRRRPVVAFLNRSHPVNRFLGQLLRQPLAGRPRSR